MNRHRFELLPFESGPGSAGFKIKGSIGRSNEKLSIDYSLTGPLKRVIIPPPANVPVRLDNLWKESCFECFIGTEHSTRYWEINLSPAGHWNLYRFEAYRFGMKEASVHSLPASVTESGTERFKIRCEVDLNAIGLTNTPIRIGPCAILKTTASKLIYWAMDHHGPKPDFHRQDGFVMSL